MLENLEGRSLLTFLAVLEEGNFSRAAEKLGYVQSTVTSQIQLLEQSCNQKLFHRLPRGVKLTEAGEQFALYARKFVQLGHSLEEALENLDHPRGTLRLGSLESFLVTRMSNFMHSFFKEYTEIHLLLETGFQADIVEQVQSHVIDFGIVPMNPKKEDLIFEPLIEEQMIVVASKNLAHLIENEGWENTSGIQMIGFGSRCVYHTEGLKLLSEMGLPSEIRSTGFASSELVRQVVTCGLGVALVPKIMMAQELAEGSVISLPLPRQVTFVHGIVRHKKHVLNTPSKVFYRALTEYFSNQTSIGSI
ncbi:LysR family transcriptional regulator [Paenibacillus sp. ACRSA]|uniref:LysR family transcriptional regulator n=1 Tax=Paenibacillus sp. ACRSA TaxID=2918211 RepID=UPI001EF6502E|nr:LysR family transcriptional regulator [Paenibacillus sp. ACRSA]MCG7379802.1 LysR family transcriptional regulator [Paenibacillus sp. ACRSA]